MSAPARARPRWPYPVGGLAVAVTALAVLLWYGGAARREPLPGLPDPGTVTLWALPAARLGNQIFAVATVGLLLASVVLSPRDGKGLSATGYRRLRAAGWAALGWSLSAATALCFSLSDLIGLPVGRAVSPTSLVTFSLTVNLGQALAVTALLAMVVFVLCRTALRPAGATVALALAVSATVPVVFTGHAIGAGDHQVAVSSQLLHVVPVTLWAGGLLALALTRGGPVAHLAIAVQRFSPLAAACLAAVTVSGVISAAIRLSSPGDLVSVPYGQLVLVKTAVLTGIAGVGWWQRRAALPALRAGDRRRFTRVAGVEILLFGAAAGAATALSRTAPPRSGAELGDPAISMLGFPMPPPMTAGRVIAHWLPDPLFITAAVAAGGLYLAGVWRLRRRGDHWSILRTASFLGGCALIIVATSSGLARYGPVLFSVHMVQHLLVAMVAPILIALAGPITLALRALPRSPDPAWPGPREWLNRAVHNRVTRAVAHPLVALVFYVISMYMMYLTPLYQLALRSHAAHIAMMVHFFAAGYLFYWVVIGVDPTPRRRSAPPLRMLLVLMAAVLHAFLGLIIMQANTLLAHDWFTALPRPWGPDPLADQRVAGGIAWSFGELPTAAVLVALFVQWIRADEREQRRLDRAADRAEAEGREDEALAAYNAMLAEAAAYPYGRRGPRSSAVPPATGERDR